MSSALTPTNPGFWHIVGFVALLWTFFLTPVWGRAVLWLLRSLLRLACYPLTRLRLLRSTRQSRRRLRGYQLLEEYAPRLRRAGVKTDPLRRLIEAGIRPSRLRAQIERQTATAQPASDALRCELEQLRTEQRKLIAQGMLQLEQMHYQDRAISTITERVRRKDLATD